MKRYLTLFFTLLQIVVYAQIPKAGLVGYYPLNGNANDSSGNGFNGTIVGPTVDIGICSSGYRFINNYIDCGNPPGGQFDLTGDASLCLWFKLKGNANSTGAGFPVLGKDVSGGTVPKWFVSVFGDSIAFHINDVGQGGGQWRYSNYYHFIVDTFYHMVITKSGNNYQFFVNANAWGNRIMSINVPTVPHAMQIGRNEAIGTNVVIDQVLIYNKVLSQAQIDSIYHNPCSVINVNADFNTANATVCAGSCIGFNNFSVNAASYQWSFPGATIAGSTNANPGSVCYNLPGQYDVQLIVSNGSSSDTLLKPLYITVNPLPDAGIISGNPTSFCAGGTAQLNNAGAAGNIQWQFSTDSLLYTDIPGAQSSSYNTSSLTQTSWFRVIAQSTNCGADTSTAFKIAVISKAIAGTISVDRDTVCQGSFTNLTDNGLEGSPIQWQSSVTPGNFADINTADDTTYKTLPLSQTTWYRVVIGSGSCSSVSDSVRIFVPPSLIALFNFKVSGTSVTFNADSSAGNIVSYNWAFGDGAYSPDKYPAHTYSKSDTTYNICLSIYDGSNCSYTFCKDVSLATAIGLIKLPVDWTIYPNPFGNQLLIDAGSVHDDIKGIVMYDVLGREVVNKLIGGAKANLIAIETSGLPAGMYYLKIRTAKADYILKAVKQ